MKLNRAQFLQKFKRFETKFSELNAMSIKLEKGHSIKTLLEPFNHNLNELRSMLDSLEDEMKSALGGSADTGRGSFSKARTIPITTSGPGSEPQPVMGDLSGLGGPKGPEESSVVEEEERKKLKIMSQKLLEWLKLRSRLMASKADKE